MKRSLALASLVLVSSAFAPAARAEEATRPPSPALSPGKKLESVNRALRGLGLPPPASLPPPQMKVTPVATKDSGGARIAFAAPIHFVGSSDTAPEGRFMLAPDPNTKAELRLEFPTEKGKLHVVDCRAHPSMLSGSVPVTFTRGTTSTTVSIEDGHYLYVFKSDAVEQTVKLSVTKSLVFYGCEITKVP